MSETTNTPTGEPTADQTTANVARARAAHAASGRRDDLPGGGAK